VTASIDSRLSSMYDQVLAFRATVNAGTSVVSTAAENVYQVVTSTRTYCEAKKNTPGLAEALRRYFFTLGVDFNPGSEWSAVRVPMDALVTWLQGNLPKDASGRPVFNQFNAVSGELEPFSITISGANKTTLLSRLDALLAAFV
jgi:hypothetical protein